MLDTCSCIYYDSTTGTCYENDPMNGHYGALLDPDFNTSGNSGGGGGAFAFAAVGVPVVAAHPGALPVPCAYVYFAWRSAMIRSCHSPTMRDSATGGAISA